MNENFVDLCTLTSKANICNTWKNTIYLCDKKFNDIRGDEFKELGYLEGICIKNTNMVKVPDGLFDSLFNIGSIRLTQNLFTTLPRDIFIKNTNITTLNISHNRLEKLPKGIFDSLRIVRDIVLSDNQIVELDENLLINNTKLVNFNISNNELSVIPPSLFKNTDHIFCMRFSNNSIKYIPEEIVKPTLVKLFIAHNPISDYNEEPFQVSNLRECKKYLEHQASLRKYKTVKSARN